MEDKLHYKTVLHDTKTIIRLIDTDRLVVTPDFRNTAAWSNTKRARFIESILMGLPAHAIWCEEEQDGRLVVLDGSNRISTLWDFCLNKFKLTSLNYLTDYEHCYFSDLPYGEVLKIEDRFTTPFFIVNHDTSSEFKSQFYWRMFETTRPFKSQVARNFGYRDGFRFLRSFREHLDDVLFLPQVRFRHRYYIDVDECLLYVFLLATPIDTRMLPGNYKVENLLDSMMEHLGRPSTERTETLIRTSRILKKIRNHYGSSIVVSLAPDDLINKITPEVFTRQEFLWSVARAAVDKLAALPSGLQKAPNSFKPGSSARDFFNVVTSMRND